MHLYMLRLMGAKYRNMMKISIAYSTQEKIIIVLYI